VHVVFSSLHTHVSADEALVVLGQLFCIQVQLELKLKLFKGPALVLGNCLSGGSQEGFGVKESSEPQATLSESRVLLQPLQLDYSLDEVCNPGSNLDSIRDLVLVPFNWRNFSEDLLSDETEFVSTLPGAFTHLKQVVQVLPDGLQEGRSDCHFTLKESEQRVLDGFSVSFHGYERLR